MTSSLRISAIGFSNDELFTIRFLLYPFKIKYVSSEELADVTICKGLGDEHSQIHKKLIIVPDNETSWSSGRGQNNISFLHYDIVSKCCAKLSSVMNPKISLKYAVATRLPFNYNSMPSALRSSFLRNFHSSSLEYELSKHLIVETSRHHLIESFNELGLQVERKRPPSVLLTHDIDTEKGLRKASALKKIENEYNVGSIWFLVSNEYQIRRDLARELAEGSEIGSHDTRHDGRLVQIKEKGRLVKRLRESRLKLGDIFEREVTNFRAPLMQFNAKLIEALSEAGYRSDFSLPCWEPVHPSTMSGFGIESVCEFEICDICEHPLTLFQDHQVLQVLRMTPSEATRFWMDQARLVSSLGGDIVLLIHPDYSFSQDLESYRKLIKFLVRLQQEWEEAEEGEKDQKEANLSYV
jgi:peptidoglycan/xylan/chitin deacetylase (PgdA/CDA1 family)